MKHTIYKKLLSTSIATALGLASMGNAYADVITTLTLDDTDADTAISGFRFATFTDISFPTGIPGTFPNDLTFGKAGEDCTGFPGGATCNGGVIEFDTGEIAPVTFTTGFNFGGGGDFQPSIEGRLALSDTSGTITIKEDGSYVLDLTALDFSGLYTGTTFLLPPQDLFDTTGIPGDEGQPVFPGDAAFSTDSTVPIILDTFTSNNDGTFKTIINFSSEINQGSTFDGQISRWRVEGTFAVTDAAPLVFIDGASGVAGDFTSNVAPDIDPYIDPGAVCQDVVDAEITPLTDVASLPVPLVANTFLRTTDLVGTSTGPEGGSFTVTYTCTDSQNNTTTAVRTVEVGDDTVPPVITLGVAEPESGRSDSVNGDTVDILVGKLYVDAGATCNDNRDGNIPIGPNFTVNPDPAVVNTDTASTGNLITFSCDDIANNGPTIAVRTVNVLADTVKPVITLENPEPRTVAVGETFVVPLTPPAVECTDTNPIDTQPVDISGNLNVNPTSIDTSVPTTSPILITYDCDDASANSADTVTLEVNVVEGENFEILSMTIADLDGDRIAGCFRFGDLNAVTCDNANRFATDSSTIDSLTDPSSATLPGTGSDIDVATGQPIGIRFGVFQDVGLITPGFNFTGFPFVPFTFDPPSESAVVPSGFVTVSSGANILTIESLPFGGRYSSSKPNDFFLDPDEGTIDTQITSVNLDDDGTTRTFNYLMTWSHFITSAEDPTGAFVGFQAFWRLEGVITAGSTPVIRNNAPLISAVTAGQAALDPTRILVVSDGLVTATAEATDPDTGDTLSYDWSASPVTPVGSTSSKDFIFDPSGLPEGLVTLKVTVTDDAAEPLSTSAELDLRVLASAPVLGTGDSDGDGISDIDEGFGDTDDDGLPDYHDRTTATGPERNLRSVSNDPAADELITSVGRLRLGRTAFKAGQDSFIVTESDIGVSDKVNQVEGIGHSGGGIADFEVAGLAPGDAVSIVIPQAVPLPNVPIYRKYVEGKGWFTFAAVSGNSLASAKRVNGVCPDPASADYGSELVEGDECVRITIVDGTGMDGDALRNGIVVDPGTVASNGPVPVGEAPQSFWNGGGCTVGPAVSYRDRLDWLLVAFFLIVLAYRNRKWRKMQ